MALLPVGELKLGWLKMLKNSTRNCTLNASEMRATCVFLTRDISKLTILGPITLLRPALPKRFAQVPAMPGVPIGSEVLNPNGWHCAAISGVAAGRVKHFVGFE